MRVNRSSKTAEHNALFRSFEPGLDPLAKVLLGPGLRVARLGGRLTTSYIDGRWPGVRTSVVARTRLIDDTITSVVPEVRRVILLGAGFDTRAHRLPALRSVEVVEVDHPATQARKRARLGGRSDRVRYVATDFTDGPPAELDTNRPTLFVWEGVTNYLDERSVDETIRWCSAAPPPSNLVFTYVDEALFDDPTAFLGARRVLATSQRVGEAVTFGMRPSAMREYLADRGFELVSDIGAAEYRTRYLGAALRGHEFYRVAHARRVHTSDASYEQP